MTSAKKFLVTGIAGLVGSALARRLLAEGHDVVGVDNLTTGFLRNVPEDAHFIRGDVQETNCIEQLDAWNFECIYHVAGQSSGEISFSDPVYDLQTNCQSTLLLLELARRTDCNSFVYASSMSVYGDPKNADIPVTEDSPVCPESFYAVGKLASENYMRVYSKQYGLNCTAMRLFNVYGPGQNMENLKQGMVSIFLAYARKRGRIVVKGSGERFRDQVYIDDITNAFFLVGARQGNHQGYFQIYNISTGEKTTVNDVLREIQNSGFNNEVEFAEATPGDQFGIFGDSRKFQEATGWLPLTSFSDGFRKMVELER